MLATAHRGRGFSLVEVMVSLAILAILAAIAMPSYTSYLNSLGIRGAAESLLAATQKARGEAIRSNNTVVLQVVDTLDNGCVADAAGRFWVISHCSAAGHCGDDIDKTTGMPAGGCADTPIILARGSLDSRPSIQSDLAKPALCYSSLGRINPDASNCPAGSLNPGVNGTAINITHQDAACIADGGTARCLRLTIGMGGEPRLCDPGISVSGDPRKC